MSEFIQIPPAWLEQNATGIREDVHLYWRGCFLAQYGMWQRLRVLSRLINRYAKGDSVLDVGGGLGLLLPTLAKRFHSVTLLDLNTTVAQKVCEYYHLQNIRIIQEDFLCHSL